MSGKNGMGKYLYGVVMGQEKKYDFPGIDGQSVHSICKGQISLVASDIPNKKIRPERRHLAAHQEVLKHLMEESTILPMSFGIIADDVSSVYKLLDTNSESFISELRRVEGKMEMGLRVTWDVTNIFQHIVDTHSELRSLRDRLFSSKTELGQEEKIQLGQMFDRFLKEDRESYTDKVVDILSPVCSEIKRNPPRNEKDVMNLACLVARKLQKDFEASVIKAASLFDNSFVFNYNGPWAPHNFVELSLQV